MMHLVFTKSVYIFSIVLKSHCCVHSLCYINTICKIKLVLIIVWASTSAYPVSFIDFTLNDIKVLTSFKHILCRNQNITNSQIGAKVFWLRRLEKKVRKSKSNMDSNLWPVLSIKMYWVLRVIFLWHSIYIIHSKFIHM